MIGRQDNELYTPTYFLAYINVIPLFLFSFFRLFLALSIYLLPYNILISAFAYT